MPARPNIQPGLFDEFDSGEYSPARIGALISSERQLVQFALALGARTVGGWSSEEEALVQAVAPARDSAASVLRAMIVAGHDPLGDSFCQIRPAEQRRARGATFTPMSLVDAMIHWAAQQAEPARVVDPGTGSGRYLLRAGLQFKDAALIGIETDPLPALLARANLAVHGLSDRARVIVADYRTLDLPSVQGRTLYIGNPPYVRHHLIGSRWKAWLVQEASRLGLNASQLAGLHVHFFLATAIKAKPRDFGAFVTAAEWLDVNYGRLVRELLLGPLGGTRVIVVEPTAMPFADAATTAVLTYFEVGTRTPAIRLKRVRNVRQIREPNGSRVIRREALKAAHRWSHLTRGALDVPTGYVELGELCRVHRGQVTGSNRVWIAGPHASDLPESVLFPTVTKARDLFRVGEVLSDASALRRVIDLPVDLDVLDASERRAIDRFLKFARERGAHQGYVATNRKAWWAVGLREPAPILATYMARRPPAFVRNLAEARHINIAHGLYPRQVFSAAVLRALVEHLNRATCVTQGRTYAGGLTKFEPREMERLLVPQPKLLAGNTA